MSKKSTTALSEMVHRRARETAALLASIRVDKQQVAAVFAERFAPADREAHLGQIEYWRRQLSEPLRKAAGVDDELSRRTAELNALGGRRKQAPAPGSLGEEATPGPGRRRRRRGATQGKGQVCTGCPGRGFTLAETRVEARMTAGPGVAGISASNLSPTPGARRGLASTTASTPGVAGVSASGRGLTPGAAGISASRIGLTPGVASISASKLGATPLPKPPDVSRKTSLSPEHAVRGAGEACSRVEDGT